MPDYRLGRLKGGFVVVWEEGGRRRRYRLGTREPKEARATLREFIRNREQTGSRKRKLVAEIYADYVADRKAEGKVSVGRMADAWKRLAPHFGSLIPDDVNAGVVRAYTAGRRNQ